MRPPPSFQAPAPATAPRRSLLMVVPVCPLFARAPARRVRHAVASNATVAAGFDRASSPRDAPRRRRVGLRRPTQSSADPCSSPCRGRPGGVRGVRIDPVRRSPVAARGAASRPPDNAGRDRTSQIGPEMQERERQPGKRRYRAPRSWARSRRTPWGCPGCGAAPGGAPAHATARGRLRPRRDLPQRWRHRRTRSFAARLRVVVAGQTSVERLVQRHAEAVLVRPRPDRGAAALLRRRVPLGAEEVVGAGQGAGIDAIELGLRTRRGSGQVLRRVDVQLAGIQREQILDVVRDDDDLRR